MSQINKAIKDEDSELLVEAIKRNDKDVNIEEKLLYLMYNSRSNL